MIPSSQVEQKLLHPWQQHASLRTGKFYWCNPDTTDTTWICPTPKVAPAVCTLIDAHAAEFDHETWPFESSY
jgi:hypothetical protein